MEKIGEQGNLTFGSERMASANTGYDAQQMQPMRITLSPGVQAEMIASVTFKPSAAITTISSTGGKSVEVNRDVTQADRVLGILKDGFWHTGLEFTRLNRPILSYTRRIFELRQAGYNIIKERRNGLWKYRLEQ